MENQINPLGDMILLKVLVKEEKQTSGGILLPEKASKERQPSQGEVLRLGSGKRIKQTGLQVGEKVIYNKYRANQVVHQDRDLTLVLVDIKDVLARLLT